MKLDEIIKYGAFLVGKVKETKFFVSLGQDIGVHLAKHGGIGDGNHYWMNCRTLDDKTKIQYFHEEIEKSRQYVFLDKKRYEFYKEEGLLP